MPILKRLSCSQDKYSLDYFHPDDYGIGGVLVKKKKHFFHQLLAQKSKTNNGRINVAPVCFWYS